MAAVIESRVFRPCFLAVERSLLIRAKCSAPCTVRKQPDIFKRTLIIRISCSARLLVNGTLISCRNASTDSSKSPKRVRRFWDFVFTIRPLFFFRGFSGKGLAAQPSDRISWYCLSHGAFCSGVSWLLCSPTKSFIFKRRLNILFAHVCSCCSNKKTSSRK